MKKMPTFFLKTEDLSRVTEIINPINTWVLTESICYVKLDGSSTAIIDGELYKRYDRKRKNGIWKTVPIGAIPCCERDELSGHHPHWVKVTKGEANNNRMLEAFSRLNSKEDGTYEFCGPKVNGNPEYLSQHWLIKHNKTGKLDIKSYTYEALANVISTLDQEGIVFHHIHSNKKCKLRKSDFGFVRKKIK